MLAIAIYSDDRYCDHRHSFKRGDSGIDYTNLSDTHLLQPEKDLANARQNSHFVPFCLILWPTLLAPVVWIFALWHLPASHNKWIAAAVAADRTCCWRWEITVMVMQLPCYDVVVSSFDLLIGGGTCWQQVLWAGALTCRHHFALSLCANMPLSASACWAVDETTRSCIHLSKSKPSLLLRFSHSISTVTSGKKDDHSS